MSKQPNIKRPRETPAGSSSLAGKRVKFASEDAIGSTSRSNSATGGAGGEEDFEEDLEDGLGGNSKKGIVTDGYDSDSSAGSDDGFGVGGGRKGKKNKDGTTGGADDEDDDDDMFGGGDEKDGASSKKKHGKGKEYLEIGDIEGQEFGKGDDGEEDDDNDIGEEEYLEEDDLANDDDAPRSSRNKSSMGYTLSSFNMADELSEGRFGADGSYIANPNDGLAVHDTWLDGVSKVAIKAARESKKRMDEEAKKREDSTKGVEALSQEKDDCLIGILGLIREGETVARALARLGAGKKKVVRATKPKAPVVKNGDDMELDDNDLPAPNTLASQQPRPTSTSTPIEEDPATKRIKLLTHLASTLLATHGEIEIYDQSYEDIIKTLKSEGAVRADWKPARDPTMIEESAAIARQEEENHYGDSSVQSIRGKGLIVRPTTLSTPSSTMKYYYRWITPPAGQKVEDYGPYSVIEMSNWISGGFFGPEGNGILVKKEGGTEWTSWNLAQN